MADDAAPHQEPNGTCPDKVHIFVWDHTKAATCPLTTACLCGQKRYADALVDATQRGKGETCHQW